MATGFTIFDTIAMKRSYACFNFPAFGFSESTYRLKIVFQFDRTVNRRVCEMLIDIMLSSFLRKSNFFSKALVQGTFN